VLAISLARDPQHSASVAIDWRREPPPGEEQHRARARERESESESDSERQRETERDRERRDNPPWESRIASVSSPFSLLGLALVHRSDASTADADETNARAHTHEGHTIGINRGARYFARRGT